MVKRVLLYSAPFLLISAAIFLFALWGIETFVEGNIYFRVATLAPSNSGAANSTPESGGASANDGGNAALDGGSSPEGVVGDGDVMVEDDDLLILDEEEKEQLKENNEGDVFVVPPEFPIITLGEQWATITIESAEVWEVPVYHGDYDENLWKGIGHYSNSRFPGQHGKVVLSGHVGIYEFFQRLETMSVGDRVVLDTIYGEYVYEVKHTLIFNETDKGLLLPDEEDRGDRLICYTCYPFRTTSVRTQRFAIICDLVSGKDWTVKESAETQEASK